MITTTMESDDLYNHDEEEESRQKKSEINSWTPEDSVRFILILNKVGRNWKMIEDNYKSHLKNKSAEKYWNLKKSKNFIKK